MESRLKNSSFSQEIEELTYFKKKLSKSSLNILYILFVSFINLSLYIFIIKSNGEIVRVFEFPVFIIAVFIAIYGIHMLYKFNQIRERGMVIYEEIGNEIDWSKNRKKFIHKPSIELRIIIREFLKSTDLPFTTGKMGQAFYLFLFLFIPIINILLKLFIK